MKHRTMLTAKGLWLLTTVTNAQAQSALPPGETTLLEPIQIVISQDIRDPDKYIDELISKMSAYPNKQARLDALKSLSRESKVEWLLDQSSPMSNSTKSEVLGVCIMVIVITTVAVVSIKKIYNAALKRWETITETTYVEKPVEKEKCD